VTYTCAHCAAHRHTQNHTQMPHRRSASPTRTLSLCCCQTKAWKAGHKGECVADARADTRTAAKPTAEQMRMLKMLEQLAGAADWRGVAAQERAAREVAVAVRASMQGNASFVCCILGNTYDSLGDFNKAIDYHGQHLAIAKEVGAHLKEHLSWRVQLGRDTCAGCGQRRGEDTQMLTCSGCRVARVCNADHQKMASKKAALGGSLTTGRHKDICGVLHKWREAVKDGVAPDSCSAELVAFLQRENA
jgi:hypothetical protein